MCCITKYHISGWNGVTVICVNVNYVTKMIKCCFGCFSFVVCHSEWWWTALGSGGCREFIPAPPTVQGERSSWEWDGFHSVPSVKLVLCLARVFFFIILIPELKRAAGGKPRSFKFKFLPRLKTVVWSLVNDEPSEGSTASAGVVNVNHCRLNTTHEDINQN